MTLVSPMHLITVVQAMTVASNSPIETGYNNIFQSAAGVVFLGTPHRGSSSANRASLLIRLLTFRSSPPLLHLLCAKSLLLNQIADQFNNIWGSRRIFSFRETKAMFNWKIVTHHSTFLRHLSHQLLLSDCLRGRCDHKLWRRGDI
jgi:protein SERAC1